MCGKCFLQRDWENEREKKDGSVHSHRNNRTSNESKNKRDCTTHTKDNEKTKIMLGKIGKIAATTALVRNLNEYAIHNNTKHPSLKDFKVIIIVCERESEQSCARVFLHFALFRSIMPCTLCLLRLFLYVLLCFSFRCVQRHYEFE